jgi:hypothetical protein
MPLAPRQTKQNVWKLSRDDRYYAQATYIERLAAYRTYTRSIRTTVGVKKPLKDTFKVYFAEQARHAYIVRGEFTNNYIRQLKCDNGTHLATTRADYISLRPYEYSEPHKVTK